MKKIALLLALVFVFSVALVACNNDENTSSEPAESSETAVESSVAVAESTDDSAEPVESSEAEASSEAPADESSEAPTESADAPNGTNVALGKSYTISGDGKERRGGEYNEHYDALLTDGKAVGEIHNEDDEDGRGMWFGFHSSTNAPDGVGHITIDLGETKKVNSARVHIGKQKEWGINAPTEVFVSVSTDGKNFKKVADFSVAALNEDQNEIVVWLDTSFDEVEAQYVRVTFYVVGTWCFINEIEAYAA